MICMDTRDHPAIARIIMEKGWKWSVRAFVSSAFTLYTKACEQNKTCNMK